ncbi:hypothetical protein GGR42_002661 [Saonia flava]|uniref:HMA domain-containing protein n=1 Tax=Saonia flava TaxID=523696 RepID=A0A846QZ18_9FLAO|nr:hypothetical protein [Saonia flava]NJB72170.1 hypothetical protein [Saonia flava]
MKTRAKLKNFTSLDNKSIILRNLSRILDIRIVDLDENEHAITFLYDSTNALEKVKRELTRIGFPICNIQKNDVYSIENKFYPNLQKKSFA